jgi:hypothetical protein
VPSEQPAYWLQYLFCFLSQLAWHLITELSYWLKPNVTCAHVQAGGAGGAGGIRLVCVPSGQPSYKLQHSLIMPSLLEMTLKLASELSYW